MYDTGNHKVGALWQPGRIVWGGMWERGSGSKGHMHANGQFIVMYGRGHHNVVTMLQLKLIILKKNQFFHVQPKLDFRFLLTTMLPIANELVEIHFPMSKYLLRKMPIFPKKVDLMSNIYMGERRPQIITTIKILTAFSSVQKERCL